MATSILRPNGTVSNTGAWTVTGATSAWDAIDDAVTQPTAATTTDRVSTLTAGHVLNLDLTASPADVETVTDVTIWMYANTAGNDRITAGLFQADNTTQIGTTQFASNMTATYTWYSATISGLSLTKSQIDGAILRLTSAAAGGMSEVRCAAAYVEITYSTPVVWPTYPAGSYPAAVTTTSGLVSYWRLGEASGTTAADEGGRYAGTNNGATVGAISLLPSSTDTAYSFDGVNDYVGTATNAAFAFSNTSPFSFECWYQPPTVPGTLDELIIGTEAANIYAKSGKIGFDRYNGTTVNTAPGTTLVTINTTYHFVATYDGTTMRFYLNGVLEGSVASSISLQNVSRAFGIGAYLSSTAPAYFADSITDEVAVYNLELSQATITDHYSKGTTAGTVAHPLTGSIAGTATVAGSLAVIAASHPLTGSVAGAAIIAATRITIAQPLAGTVAGRATITGTGIKQSHPLTGSVAGAATITAAISGAPSSHPLTGAVAGTSTITASQISEAQPLTGSVAGQASVTVARLVMDHALVGLVPGMASVTGLITMAQPLAGTIAGVATISGQLSGPVVSYPWPATVTFAAVGGPAVSLTTITSPSGQPGAIADAPAVSLSAISVLTVTLAGVSDGPATSLASITSPSAQLTAVQAPDGTWTAVLDTADISGVVPGPDATISIVALPGSTFTAVPVPSGAGSLILEPTARVAAISDGPAITPVVYTMPEG
ncbi:MAG: LamG domain-containing protein [Chloroflexota bacterium]|nr:LamG domain-containing protein [Chloroflexota bacterium]